MTFEGCQLLHSKHKADMGKRESERERKERDRERERVSKEFQLHFVLFPHTIGLLAKSYIIKPIVCADCAAHKRHLSNNKVDAPGTGAHTQLQNRLSPVSAFKVCISSWFCLVVALLGHYFTENNQWQVYTLTKWIHEQQLQTCRSFWRRSSSAASLRRSAALRSGPGASRGIAG